MDFTGEILNFIDKFKDLVIYSKDVVLKSAETCSCGCEHHHVESKQHEDILENILWLMTNFERNIFVSLETSTCQQPQGLIVKPAINARSHVAHNPLILSKIFGYLNLKSIKLCRLVSPSWKALCEPFMKKISKVRFSDALRLEKFEPILEEADFLAHSIEFKELTCEVVAFTAFLTAHRNIISELTIDSVTLTNESVELRSLNISNLISPNLRTLKITGETRTRLKIELEKLADVEDIALRFCTLIINEKENGAFKIAPKSINLASVLFIRKDGTNIEPVTVNDFVRFYRMDFLKLSRHPPWKTGATKEVQIQLTDPNININSLKLYKITLDTKILSNIKKLEFTSFVNYNLDISMLPESLETLICSSNLLKLGEVVRLPNLKQFKCSIPSNPKIDEILFLHTFIASSNLTKIQLRSVKPFHFNISMLPKTVDMLILENIVVSEFKQGNPLKLLYLVNYQCIKTNTILNAFPVEELFIELSTVRETLAEYYSYIVKVPPIVQKLIMGPFIWLDESQFITSTFASLVDKRSKYYVFENGLGKALRWNPFGNAFHRQHLI